MTSPQIEHFPRAMIFKWLLMAASAGSVNAGGYLACRRFVTHVTGFATLFGIDAASGRTGEALGALSVPLFFLFGVMVGAFFTDTALAKGRKPRYGIVMGLVALLLLAAALGGHFQAFGLFDQRYVLERDYALLAVLCMASGLQNAAITTASRAVMRATHLTGITTDLGIGLMRALFGRAEPEQRRRELYRNWLRVGIVASFALGGLLGAFLFIRVQYLGFLLPLVLSLYVGNLGVRAVSAGAAEAAEKELPRAS